MIELNWYKIGYKNYNYYLSRKYLCYRGKKITFQRSQNFFQEVMLEFFQVIYPREDKPYIKAIEEHFKK